MTPLHARVVEAMARAAEPNLWNTIDYYRSPARVRDCGNLADYVSDASCGRQRAALTAAVSALAAEGWGVRPDVATEEMLKAGFDAPSPSSYADCDNRREMYIKHSTPIYKAMIAAAPSPWEGGE